jgi:hypothetical protein
MRPLGILRIIRVMTTIMGLENSSVKMRQALGMPSFVVNLDEIIIFYQFPDDPGPIRWSLVVPRR